MARVKAPSRGNGPPRKELGWAVIRSLAVGALLARVLGLGIGLGLGASGWLPAARTAVGQPVAPVPPAELVVAPEGSAERATIDLFQRTRDSVVAISTSAARRSLFGVATTEVPLGTGSGWVWDGDGHILTNAHVLEGATAASVQLADGRAFDARLV